MKKMLKVNMLRLLLGMSTLVFFGISGSLQPMPAIRRQRHSNING